MTALRRLKKEVKKFTGEDAPNNCFAEPYENNIYRWRAQIYGSEATPYQGGIFHLSIDIPTEYPFKPPKVHFDTKIFHPNIGKQGSICLDLLKNKWSPALTLEHLLIAICSLLDDPNPDDPLNIEAGNLYIKDKNEFNMHAMSMTRGYAIPK